MLSYLQALETKWCRSYFENTVVASTLKNLTQCISGPWNRNYEGAFLRATNLSGPFDDSEMLRSLVRLLVVLVVYISETICRSFSGKIF